MFANHKKKTRKFDNFLPGGGVQFWPGRKIDRNSFVVIFGELSNAFSVFLYNQPGSQVRRGCPTPPPPPPVGGWKSGVPVGRELKVETRISHCYLQPLNGVVLDSGDSKLDEQNPRENLDFKEFWWYLKCFFIILDRFSFSEHLYFFGIPVLSWLSA